jgi:hypothetical protein
MIAGLAVFSPSINYKPSALAAGASTSFSFQVTTTKTSKTPSIVTVNGLANGASQAGVKASGGVDYIAQAVSTAALNVAVAYENNKLPNNGDADYAQYDSFIWDAHAYVLSGSTIAFDPNVPGYAFIPDQAKAELAFAQLDASVASYLVDGLESCFAGASGGDVFNFRAGILKNYAAGSTNKGTLIGVFRPGNTYDVNAVVDNYTTVGTLSGSTTFTSTLTSTVSPVSAQDYWFGILTSSWVTSFSNTTAVVSKFIGNNHTAGGNQVACSPFNGPGGTTNPSFTITLNGQNIPARFQGVGAQCNNACTSTLVMDPVPYMTAGPQYDIHGNLLGPEINPFTINPDDLYAVKSHASQYANEMVGGSNSMGQFTAPVTLFGVTKYEFALP